MRSVVDVDVWVRGTQHATTHRIASVSAQAQEWTDHDVRQLLSEMLLALDRAKNPGSDTPPITLRGFSWIVSPDDSGGVLLHLDMHSGTVSAGPFAIDERRLSEMITRVMEQPPRTHVH